MSKFCIRKGLLVSFSSQLNSAENKLTSLSRYTLSGLVMSGYETDDYVFNTCETVEVQDRLGRYVAAIFRKPPNGKFEVHGACLVRNELKQKDFWGSPRRFYRDLRIVTSSGGVLDIERHDTNDYRMKTTGYKLTGVKTVHV